GHLTYYFPKKRDLVIAVARRAVELVARELADYFRSDGWPGADASTRSKALALLGFLIKDRQRTRFLLGLILEAEEDPKLKELMIANAGQAKALLSMGLGGKVDGPDLDLVMATLWGLGIQHLLFADARSDDYTDKLIARLSRWGKEGG